jgi:TPR repeat protein
MRYTSIQGYSESKKFYSPDYSNMKPQEKDYRRTLLWNPEVKTENGEATIEFYNSSSCSNIVVDVAGRHGYTIFSNDDITFTREHPDIAERCDAMIKKYKNIEKKEEPMDSASLAACAHHHEKALIYYNQRRYKDAVTMFAELAQYRYAPSIYYIALCYLNGTGLTKNHELAYKFMHQAATLGHPEAQYDLSEMTRKGTGTEKDNSLAEMWRVKAIDSEEPRALMEAVHEYRNAGLEEEAREFITKAAKQQHPEGLYEYGKMLIKEGKEGIPYIEAAAGHKCADAMIYMLEQAHEAKNYKLAYKYARELDLMGNSHGTKRMADYYYSGKGIGRDRSTAIDLYRKAANAGNEDAKKALRDLRK